MSDKTVKITDENFEELVIKSDKLVIVDFWAEWCGPCKAIAPILDEICDQFGDKVVVGKVNVDEVKQTPVKYGIRSIPTFYFLAMVKLLNKRLVYSLNRHWLIMLTKSLVNNINLMTDKTIHNTIIIGSGPAGLTSAIYAGRANLKPIVFEGNQPGGQLTITTDVENYPGFPNGVMGPEMMDLFRDQAKKFGAECFFKHVTKVDFSSKPYKVFVGDDEFLSETIIISTGASARMLGLKEEDELMGYGISTCATCDGYFFKNKNIVVVGGGDSAMEEASFLTKFAKKVTIIHRREVFKASKNYVR